MAIDANRSESTGGRTGVTELYRHFDSDGRLLYVGISLSTIVRLFRHRQNRAKWFNKIAIVKVERFQSISEARAAETRAIKEEKPLHNIVLTGKGRKHNQNPKVIEAILSAGGVSSLARLINVERGTVNAWRTRGIPGHHVLKVEAAIGGAVTRHDLRPDLYPRGIT